MDEGLAFFLIALGLILLALAAADRRNREKP